MIAPALSLPTRDDPETMTDRCANLTRANLALARAVTEYKRREQHYVRCISEMLNTPATSVASAKYADGQWQVVMSSGAVWERVERVIDTAEEYRICDEWVSRPAVPGTRAAISEQLAAALALCPKVA